MADVFVDSVDKRTTADELVADVIQALSSGVDTIADYELSVPQILTGALMEVRPGVVKNTKLILIPRATSSFIGPATVYYNRIHSSEIFPLRVLKGSAINTEELIPAINQQYKLHITTEDIINEPLPQPDSAGYVTVNLQMKPTSLIFYGSNDVGISDPGQTAGDTRPVTTTGDSINYQALIPSQVALEKGDLIDIVPHVKSGGAPTLKVNNFPVTNIKQYNNLGEKIVANLIPEALVTLYYDGVDWMVTNPIPDTPATLPAVSMKSTITMGNSSSYSATIEGLTAITAGVKVPVTFHTSSISSPTLSINNNAPAPIKQYNSDGTLIDVTIVANQTSDMYYDGTNWILLGNGVSGIDSLPSVAQLRMRSKGGRKTYMLLGYYTPGDNGGGLVYLDESDKVSADNGGSIFVSNDGGRWKRVERGNMTLEHFGARPGGVADCTTAIMNAQQAGVFTLDGRNNTYLVTTLNLYSDVTLKDINLISGGGNQDNAPVVNIDGTLYGKSNITLSNVTIDGKRALHTDIGATSEGGGRHGIRVRGRVHDLFIENVSVKDAAGDGLYMYSENVSYPAFTSIVVDNCNFTGSRRHGVSLDSTRGVKFKNLVCNNNGLDQNTTDAQNKGTRGSRGSNGVLNAHGMLIWSTGLGKHVDNVLIDQADMLGNANTGLKVQPGNGGSTDSQWKPFNRINVAGGNYDCGLDSDGSGLSMSFNTPGLAAGQYGIANVVVSNAYIDKGLLIQTVNVGYYSTTINKKNAGYHASVINSKDITINLYTQEATQIYEENSSIIHLDALDKMNSVIDLKSQAIMNRRVYQVLGYFTPGDGGGGVYVYDSTDVTTPGNDGTVVIGPDGTSRWKLIHPGVVSVRKFGAMGKGVVDEHIYLQRALDSGLHIEPEDGTYLISNTLVAAADGQSFVARNRAKVIFKNTTTDKTLFQLGSSPDSVGKQAKNMRIGGFTLMGNANSRGGLKLLNTTDDAIANSVTGARIENIGINAIGNGYGLDLGSPKTTAKDLDVTNTLRGLRIGSELQNSTIERIGFDTIAKEAISSTSTVNKVINNNFTDIVVRNSSDTTVYAMNLTAGLGNTFENILLDSNKSTADIYVGANAHGTSFRNTVHSLSNTVASKRIFSIANAQQTTIESVVHTSGTISSMVLITGTNPTTHVRNTYSLGGVVTKIIDDVSDSKLTSLLDNKNNVIPNLTLSAYPGTNNLTLVDSTTGQTKGFFKDGGFYMSNDTSGSWINAISQEVYLNYGQSNALAFFSAAQLRLGTKTGPLVITHTSAPEGVKTAPVGSLCLVSGGANQLSIYTKISGTGNTGWRHVGSLLNQKLVIQGGTAAANGAQIVLGMGSNLASSILDESANTWNIKSDINDSLSIHSVSSAGANKIALLINKTTGVVDLPNGGTVPNQSSNDNSLKIANTAYIKQEIDALVTKTGVGSGAAAVGNIDDTNLTNGYYDVISTTAGSKPGSDGDGNGLLQVIRKGDASVIRQIYFDNTLAKTWTRTYVSGFWSAWDEIADIDSPAFTGIPTAPTAAAGTSTGQIATTSFATTGIANHVALSNPHSQYAMIASPTFTGIPLAPTAAIDTSTKQIATTEFVMNQASSLSPNMDGTASAGSLKTYARADHVHPVDTTRAPTVSPTFTGATTFNSTVSFIQAVSFNYTGAMKVPVGTTAQRPTGVTGLLRYNSTTNNFEGYKAAGWGSIGGGATGGGLDDIFYENSQVVTTSYTLPSGRSASTTGPITISNGAVITVSSGSRWVIL